MIYFWNSQITRLIETEAFRPKKKSTIRRKNYCGYLILFIQTHKEKNLSSEIAEPFFLFALPYGCCCAFVNFPLSRSNLHRIKKCDIEGYIQKVVHITYQIRGIRHSHIHIRIAGRISDEKPQNYFFVLSSHFHKSVDCDT
jgi:hypothetical protein